MQVAASSFSGEACAQFTVGGDAPSDEDAISAEGFLCIEGLAEQVADDGVLKAGDQVESLRVGCGQCILDGWFGRSIGAGEEGFATSFSLGAQVVEFDVAKDGCFDAGEREEKARVEVGDRDGFRGLGAGRLSAEVRFGFDLRERKWDSARVAVLRKRVDPRPAGIAEPEQLGDLVVGFAGGIIDGAADERIGPCAVCRTGEVEMSVSAGNDEGQRGVAGILRVAVVVEDVLLLALVEEDGVNVAFKMVDGDERKILREGQRLGIGDADEQRAGETWAGGDSDGVKVAEADLRLLNRCTHDRNDGAEMLATGEFRDDSAVARVSGDLRCDDGRKRAGTALDDSSSGLVAGRLDGEDEAVTGHVYSLASQHAAARRVGELAG